MHKTCSYTCCRYPNDERELDRQDLEHRNQLIQMGTITQLCPLSSFSKRQVLTFLFGT